MVQEVKAIIRVLNTDIPGQRKVLLGLTKVYGISRSFANAVCEVNSIEQTKPIGALTPEEVKNIEETIQNPQAKKIPSWLCNRKRDYDTGEDKHITGPTLKLRKEFDIRHLKKIKSYKGMRHAFGLPVRGQRTKGHFRHGKTIGVVKKKEQPSKGKKKTGGGGKKK